MRATDFEFRHRFFFIAGAFLVAFLAYAIDSKSAAVALLDGLGVAPTRAALHALFAAGAVVVTLGAALRTWASAYLSGAVVHDTALHSDRLVADGPYRHVRNPLYFGLALLALGQAPVASRSGALFLLVALPVVGLRLVGREEAELAATQGASFQNFLQRVPKFVPSLTPRLPAAGRVPSWREGFQTEIFIWILAFGSWAFALTLDMRGFGLTCLIGMAIYWPVALLQRRRRAAQPVG